MSCIRCASVERGWARAALTAPARWFHRCGTRPRLTVLSEDRGQRQALTLAVRRAYDELAPMFGDAPSVTHVVVQRSLHRAFGAELRAVVGAAQRDGAPAFVVWLATRPAGAYIGPEGVAAVLSDVLRAVAERAGNVSLELGVPVAVPAETKDGRMGVDPLPRAAADREAEGTVVEFRRSPLGPEAPTRNGA
jgi:hypothetical protein